MINYQYRYLLGYSAAKRSLLLNFRRVLSSLLLLAIFGFFTVSRHTGILDREYSPQSQVHSFALFEASRNIKGDDKWHPNNVGMTEYFEGLPHIEAGAVVDLDTGEVWWSRNLKKRIAPASLTKVATVMTALDSASLDKVLTVSKEASEQIPTKLGLREGEKLTLSEASTAAILTSANDATEAIADSLGQELGQGTPTFMQLVNEKVRKIGALDTHFVTATGLDDPRHYSTVYDLAIIAHEAKTNYPYLSQIASLGYSRLNGNNNHKMFDLPNWNALLGVYPGVNGMKIGYTEEAGHSTMVTAERDGKKLVAIVIGADSIVNRELAAAALLNFGFFQSGIEPVYVYEEDLIERFEDWRRQLTMATP